MQQPAQFAGPQVGTGAQSPASHASLAPQPLQTSPPLPHATRVVVITQLLPAQQPGQLLGPHSTVAWQVRSLDCPWGTQTRARALQSAHAWPCLPHAMESLPATQVVPSQQPPQFWGPQVGVPSQRPPAPFGDGAQVRPVCVQLAHDSPRDPHAWLSLPPRHVLPTQQPLQLVASHFSTVHSRDEESHERPCWAQSVQLSPERPQAVGSLPARQVGSPPPNAQQPVGQSAGPQSVTLRPQTFPRVTSQNWKPPAMQSEHCAPRDPQAWVSAPMRHVPRLSQQPFGQLDGPHAPASGNRASDVSTSRLERPQPGATTARKRAAKSVSPRKLSKRGSGMGGNEDRRMKAASR